MHIVFSCVTNWQVTILKILKYLGFEVFYLHIDASLDVKKRSAIAEKLKKNNIFPIPIEFQKKFLRMYLFLYAILIRMKLHIKKIWKYFLIIF